MYFVKQEILKISLPIDSKPIHICGDVFLGEKHTHTNVQFLLPKFTCRRLLRQCLSVNIFYV